MVIHTPSIDSERDEKGHLDYTAPYNPCFVLTLTGHIYRVHSFCVPSTTTHRHPYRAAALESRCSVYRDVIAMIFLPHSPRSLWSPIIVQLMRLLLYYGPLNIGVAAEATVDRPHIVVILADDLGFDDVSLHGSDQIPTPNIDALGYQGQILNRHYVAPMCTPSRSVLMTGKYMIRTGMQHSVISNAQPWGLPVQERVLPEYLRELGYRTNLVGKWHLGFAWNSMTPTSRGFDHFRGYLGAYIDYYEHFLSVGGMTGYDRRQNKEVDFENRGKYATDMITEYAVEVIERHNATQQPLFLMVNHLAPHTGNANDPLQAPEEYVNRFSHIKDVNRRIYAAMVTKLDESVGYIVDSLKRKNVLKDTVILFSSDNGAPTLGEHANRGSNFPLRGQKDSPWEGAIRSAAAFWSAKLQTRHINNDKLIYIGDWLPTFLNLAKAPQLPPNIDGVDQWQVLSRPAETPCAREEILHNIDPLEYVSYLRGDGYKYINGTTLQNQYGGWYGLKRDVQMDSGEYFKQVKSSKTWRALNEFSLKRLTQKDIMDLRSVEFCQSEQPSSACDPLKAPCLFNVFEDACERNNLAEEKREILRELEEAVQKWRLRAVPINNKPIDPFADPRYSNGVWNSWKGE